MDVESAPTHRSEATTESFAPAISGLHSRVSVWLWFWPSALFIGTATIIQSLIDPRPIDLFWATVAGTLLAVAAAVASIAVRYIDQPAIEAVVPIILLLAAAVVHSSSQGALHSTMLLTGLPVAWLAFTFDIRGTLLAVFATVAIAVSPFMAATPFPSTDLERWDTALPAAALIGMAAVTYGAGTLLGRVRAAVVERTSELQREVSTTRAVIESAHAAVAVFVPGQAPQLSSQTVDMCRRAGISDRRASDSPDSFVGVHVFDADRESATPPHAQALLRASRGRTYPDVVQWVGTDDDRRAMVCRSSHIVDQGGSLVGTVFVAWDATELLDSVRVREEFLGTVGHELRTPLAAIIGYLDLYADEAERAPTPGDLLVEAAKRQVSALGDRIEDLLQAALPRRIWTTTVDIVPPIRAMVSAGRADARAGVELTLDAPDELIVDVNPGAFNEIVSNLLSNALNHTHDGSVRVALEPLPPAGTQSASAGFSLVVIDTGVGMNDREVQQVFDRFYRTEETVRRVIPGLGVGLTVAKQLVLAHQGTITVRSTPGEGTLFRVTIPPITSTLVVDGR